MGPGLARASLISWVHRAAVESGSSFGACARFIYLT